MYLARMPTANIAQLCYSSHLIVKGWELEACTAKMPATSQKVHLVACQCSRCEMGSLSLLWPPQGQQKQLQKRTEISKTNWFSESSAFWHCSHIMSFFPPSEICQEKIIPLIFISCIRKSRELRAFRLNKKGRELSIAARRACADRIKRNADQHGVIGLRHHRKISP